MSAIDFWYMLSNIVTVFGLPLAIFLFIYEQRKEREDAKESTYLALSDAYAEFLRLVIANPDLRLRSQPCIPNPNEEQRERMLVIFDILVSLFERAYILVYEVTMSRDQLRRWRSWEDYMREWCRRDDFRTALPGLLQGEDPAFADYIRKLAGDEAAAG
jgi:hypothetical protein